MSGESPSPPPAPAPRAASREHADSTAFSTIAGAPEIRRIVVAQGIQFTNATFDARVAVSEADGDAYGASHNRRSKTPHYLLEQFQQRQASAARRGRAFLDQMVMIGGDRAWYLSVAQNVLFELRVTLSKREFKEALETPGLHVIYSGHARYGRGPCFGPDESPGEDWSNGTDRTERGLLRMGFPYIAVPVNEIIEHGYTANPVISDGTVPPAADRDPDLRHRRLREFSFDDLLRSAANPRNYALADTDLRPRLPAGVNDSTRFWGYDASEHGTLSRHVVLHADWENTECTPQDLGATDVQCKVFCHLGCSTFRHNHPIVRQRRNWRRDGDNHHAYWTSDLSYCGITTNTWLNSIFTYPERNDNQPWTNSIQWAVSQTNRELRRLNQPCHLI